MADASSPGPAVVATERAILAISHSAIEPDPGNPRRGSPDEVIDVSDLVGSVRTHGVIQALWVRSNEAQSYRIILGERRWLAAGQVGLAAVPCEIHDELSDEEVLEIQLVENAARVDLPPLREAAAFERLRVEHRLDIGDIAARIGKSERLIRRRLALLILVDVVREALASGKLTLAGAEMLATVSDPAAQTRAFEDARDYRHDEGPKTPIGPSDLHFPIVRTRLRLVAAGFDRADATLVSKAGACMSCPKRTGSQRALFSDLEEDDACTDRGCFEAKQEAHAARLVARAKETGAEVLEGERARKLFSTFDGKIAEDAKHVDLDAPCTIIAKPKGAGKEWKPPTWSEALGGALAKAAGEGEPVKAGWKPGDPAPIVPAPVEPTTIAIAPDGRPHKLLDAKAARKALAKAGVEIKSVVREPSKTAPAKPPPAPAVDIEEIARARALASIYDGAFGDEKKPWAFVAGLVARTVYPIDSRIVRGAVERRKLPEKPGRQPSLDALIAFLAKCDEEGARGLVVEMLAAADETGEDDDVFALACRRYKVDPKKIEDEERAKIEAAKKPEPMSKLTWADVERLAKPLRITHKGAQSPENVSGCAAKLLAQIAKGGDVPRSVLLNLYARDSGDDTIDIALAYLVEDGDITRHVTPPPSKGFFFRAAGALPALDRQILTLAKGGRPKKQLATGCKGHTAGQIDGRIDALVGEKMLDLLGSKIHTTKAGLEQLAASCPDPVHALSKAAPAKGAKK